MSKLLRDLLAAKEPFFTQSLRELEYVAEKKGVDVRLTAAVIEKSNAAIRSLGLDIADTTDKELFYALNHRVGEHDENLARGLGISSKMSMEDSALKMIAAIDLVKIPRKCWVLKKSVAKDLLREMPPKRMMKHLGYRSIESMLKSENFAELYAAIRFSEDESWLGEYNTLFEKRVAVTDFENRAIEIVAMDFRKWGSITNEFVAKKHHVVTHAKEVGVIGIVPVARSHMRGFALMTLPLLFHYINEIRLYSSFFKLKSTLPNFGAIMTDTLALDSQTGVRVANFNIHWRVIQRYFGSAAEETPEVFHPHVQPEDLHWRKAAELLYELSPELKFWEDMEYVGRLSSGARPVSLNLLDVVFSYSNKKSFENRYTYHMRDSLWNEIFIRYLGEPVLRRQVLQQLSSGMIHPESLV